jgi:hypothetical protein
MQQIFQAEQKYLSLAAVPPCAPLSLANLLHKHLNCNGQPGIVGRQVLSFQFLYLVFETGQS